MLTANQRQRIADPTLQQYLAYIATNIHHTYYSDVPFDDILSTMNLYIAERAERDPAFLDQAPGYISKSAAWAARDYCKRERHGRSLQPQLLDREDDEGALAAERIAAPLADLDLPIDIHAALATLSEKRQRIAEMLVAGFQRKEIAETFGVKSPTLSWDLAQIRKALAPVYAEARG